MSDLIRCTACDGKKKVMKLGGFEGDCDQCVGIGWIKLPEEVPTPVTPVPETIEKPIKAPALKKQNK